jgi:hypothetical protein
MIYKEPVQYLFPSMTMGSISDKFINRSKDIYIFLSPIKITLKNKKKAILGGKKKEKF